MQTIYIIGAGAIGQALAVVLTQQRRKVVLLRGSVEVAAPYQETIRLEMPDEQALEALVTFSSFADHQEMDGLFVLTNKSYGNTQVATALAGRAGHSPIVLLQNGLRVEEAFSGSSFPAVYRCVLFVTSQFTGPQTIRFKPVMPSPVGTIKGSEVQLQAIVDLLHTPWFPFRAEAAIELVTWKKAIANSVFNSICPLLEVDNGIFHRNQQVLGMARRVVAECVSIARAKGVMLSEEEVLESVLMISRLSDGQLISTLQDIRQRRPTEIETLNAAIAGYAAELGLEQQVKETALLGELTRLRSVLGR